MRALSKDEVRAAELASGRYGLEDGPCLIGFKEGWVCIRGFHTVGPCALWAMNEEEVVHLQPCEGFRRLYFSMSNTAREQLAADLCGICRWQRHTHAFVRSEDAT